MKTFFASFLSTVALAAIIPVDQAQAAPRRITVASTDKVSRQNPSVESEDFDEPTNPAPRKKAKAKTSETESFDKHWYLRIQQLPFLGMAAVSDNGVLDLELMRAVNENFHIGPTTVFHYGKQADTKMKSFNLGVRADMILPDFGNLDEVYVSTSLMFGYYSTNSVQYTRTTYNEPETLTCDFQTQGFHRVGAIAVGKIWRLSDSIHVTTGLGAVKSKTFNGTITRSGFCENRDIRDSEGTELPWLDFGVGFKI